MLPDQLIPINQVAKLARTDKVHLAYLTKLRLIPQTIRRKIDNKITGCYPQSVITMVHKIEELKDRGLTYSQIRLEMNKPAPVSNPQFQPSNSVSFLIIGLTLGYLLATVNGANINKNQLITSSTTLPVETPTNYQKILQTKIQGQNSDEQIYLIALPEKNLYKLGEINLDL